MLGRLWVDSGVRPVGTRGSGKNEFKLAHGFRKFFKTQASKGVARPEAVESMMGHVTPYFRPSVAELEEEYLKALPFITVSETAKLKEELATVEEKHKSDYQGIRLEMLELKDSDRAKGDTIKDMRTDMRKLAALIDDPELKEKYAKHTEPEKTK
jgi:hypothetical protein